MLLPLANAGAVLLTLEQCHLLVGDFVIAVVETVLLRALFRVPLRRGFLPVLCANYVSMAVGTVVVMSSGGLQPALSPLAARWALVGSATTTSCTRSTATAS